MRRKTLNLGAAAAAACLVAGASATFAAQGPTGANYSFVGNDVANGSFATGTAGWQASSAGSAVSLSRVANVTGVPGASSAMDVTSSGNTGSWGEVLGDLTSPGEIRAGQTYRAQVWVRDMNASGHSLGVLLANAHYADRPSDDSTYLGFNDRNWHLITDTFTATADAKADTQFYVALPTNTPVHLQLSAASVSVRTDSTPSTATTTTFLQSSSGGHRGRPSYWQSTTTSTAPTPAPSTTASTAPRAAAPTSSTSTSAAPVTSTSSRAATVSSPSGQSMPTGDLAGWHQVFTDDFTKAAAAGSFLNVYGAKWGAYNGFGDTDKIGQYSSNVLSASNGLLDMYLHTANGTPQVAAPVPYLDGAWGGQLYGRYSVRFRADSLANYKTAWLLWPDNNNWSDGEIDFPEGDLNGTIHAYDHQIGNPSQNALAAGGTVTYGAWHTATTEWTPGGVKFYLDGTLIGSSPVSPHVPMHAVLQTETNGRPATSTAGNVQLDWISIWSYTG